MKKKEEILFFRHFQLRKAQKKELKREIYIRA